LDDATFPTRLDEFRFERPEAFPIIRPPFKIPVTVRVTMFAVVMTLRFEHSRLETEALDAFRKLVSDVLVLRRLKKAVLAPRPSVTLAVVNHPVVMLAVPETLRFTRVPKLVIFDWVFESWREVRGLTRFDELRLESPEAFPKYNWEVRVSTSAPPTTVKEYPGLEVVWMPTFPSGSMTMARVVKSQNSATF
jgi:hypothetical protein